MRSIISKSVALAFASIAALGVAAAQGEAEKSDFERALNDRGASIMRDNEGNATGVRTDGDVGGYVGGSAESPTREQPEGDVTVEGGVVFEF